jgi:hypothetical protein
MGGGLMAGDSDVNIVLQGVDGPGPRCRCPKLFKVARRGMYSAKLSQRTVAHPYAKWYLERDLVSRATPAPSLLKPVVVSARRSRYSLREEST